MSVLTDLIYSGADTVAGLAENAVNTAITKHGPDRETGFPGTDCFYPVLYGLSGLPVRTLGDLPKGIAYIKSLITNEKNMDQARRAGLAALLGAEILEGLKYLDQPAQQSGPFLTDQMVLDFASSLTQGSYPGCAVILGRTEEPEDLLKIIHSYQRKGIVTFLVGSCIDQCLRDGIETGLHRRVVPLRRETVSMVHSFSAAVRGALLLGGVRPGDQEGVLRYTAENEPVFINTFGTVDAIGISLICGAMALGFPTVTDMDLGENQIPGMVESVCDHAETIKCSLKLAGVKIRVRELLNWAMENDQAELDAKSKKT